MNVIVEVCDRGLERLNVVEQMRLVARRPELTSLQFSKVNIWPKRSCSSRAMRRRSSSSTAARRPRSFTRRLNSFLFSNRRLQWFPETKRRLRDLVHTHSDISATNGAIVLALLTTQDSICLRVVPAESLDCCNGSMTEQQPRKRFIDLD